MRMVLGAILLSLCVAVAEAKQSVALVITHGDYAVLPDRNPDVSALEGSLAEQGFAVTSVRDAPLLDVLDAIERFKQASADASRVLVYLDGYAGQVDGGIVYVPQQATLTSQARLPYETIGLGSFLAAASSATGTGLLILNAAEPPMEQALEAAGAVVDEPAAAVVVHAGDAPPDLPNALARALDSEPTTLGALLAKLAPLGVTVAGTRDRLDLSWTGAVSSVPSVGDGLFLPPPPSRASLTKAQDQETVYWQSSGCTQGDAAGCNAYLQAFPDGVFASLATLRLATAVLDFDIDAADAQGIVTQAATVRSGPGREYPELATLRMGDALVITGTVTSVPWWRVRLDNGRVAFVPHAALKIASVTDAPTPPAPEAPTADAVPEGMPDATDGLPDPSQWLRYGEVSEACPVCVDLVDVSDSLPRIRLTLRNKYSDQGLQRLEYQQPRRLWIARTEVTFDQFDAFARATGQPLPSDSGWGRGQQPVINVTHKLATAYADWLAVMTKSNVRLPTEFEWEAAARGGASSRYWWGRDVGEGRAACRECGSQWDGRQSAPVASFPPNAYGVHDTAGNVWEWVDGCRDVSNDNLDVQAGARRFQCDEPLHLGGSWNSPARHIQPKYRYLSSNARENPDIGFRVVVVEYE